MVTPNDAAPPCSAFNPAATAVPCRKPAILGCQRRTRPMQNRNRGRYEIAGSEVVAEGGDMRVSVLTLAAGQEVPWHDHSEIPASFACLEGPMVVETRAPRHAYRLEPGQRCAVPPKTAHPGQGIAARPRHLLSVQA